MHWMPNSAAILINAAQSGHKARVFWLDVSTKEMRPVLPEGIRGGLPSPDGEVLLGMDGNTPKTYTTTSSTDGKRTGKTFSSGIMPPHPGLIAWTLPPERECLL
jgi:hypothetical protein